jgi:hypothetical protein
MREGRGKERGRGRGAKDPKFEHEDLLLLVVVLSP